MRRSLNISKPRVAISVMADINVDDGTTVRAKRIAEILKANFDIIIITRTNSVTSKTLDSLGVEEDKIMCVKPRGTKLWNLKIIPFVLKNKLSVVYCSGDLPGFFTYYLLSKIINFKIVYEAHALAHREREQISKIRGAIYFLIETFIGKRANAIIALSGIAYNFYRKLNRKAFFVPVFIDDEIFQSCKKKKNKLEKIVGIIGPFNFINNKYQIDFLYANLDKFDKRIRFKIIGECHKKLEINNERLEYTGYLESLEEYINTLCQLDAILAPINFATYGPKNKIIEAMACSLPVFTTPKGIVGLDFAKPTENILVFEEKDLVEKLNELIFDNYVMITIGESARKTVESNYSKDLNKKRVLYALEKILYGAC